MGSSCELPPEDRRPAGPMPERDFLDRMIDKRAARNPEFPRLVDAARSRRELLRALAGQREGRKRR